MVKPGRVIEEFVNVQNNLADFINTGPDDGIQGYIRDQYRDRCDQFANLPGWARGLANGTSGTMNRICQPWWSGRGFDGPNSAPPFAGGQCNELYIVRYQGTTSNPNGTYNVRQKTWGPVGGARSVPTGGGTFRVEIQSSGGLIATQLCSGGNPSQGPFQFRDANVTIAGTDDGGTFSIQTACGADNCGDPPSEPTPGPNPPPDPGPTPGPEPTDDPDGGPIPFIPIPPFDDPVFGPTPVEPGADPDAEGGEPPTAGGGDGLPGTDDSVGGEAGNVAGGGDGQDVDFGPPPEGRVWVGAILEHTVDTRFGNIPGTGPENTVYPFAIANASLIYQGGRGRSFDVRSKFFELFRPVTTLVVTGARVQCQPGVSASVRPVSAIICPENTCGDSEDG